MFPVLPLASTALFLDVDGTLIDIAPNPGAVVVPPSLLRDLKRLQQRLDGALALVSGRTIEDLDHLFAPVRLRASGVHGAEFRFEPDGRIEMLVETLPVEVWSRLLELLTRYPGTFAENKAFSFAIHYRAAPTVGPDLRRELEAFLADRVELGLALMPGHFVFELKRPGINKGAAITRFLDQPAFRGRRPVFLGDDVTDRPGFDLVTSRDGLAYAVTAQVAGVAGTFPDPAAVRHWLAALAAAGTTATA